MTAETTIGPARKREVTLALKVMHMIELMLDYPTMTLSDEARRTLPSEITTMRRTLFDDGHERLVGAEAACAVELMIALDDARAMHDASRASRMRMFLNSFVPFLRTDLNRSVAAMLQTDIAGASAQLETLR
jgi:hypothetical protein